MTTFAPAQFRFRFLAWLYDLLLLLALFFAMSLIAIAINRGQAIPPGTWWYDLLLAAVVVAFYVIFWVKGGQTLGMRAWRLRVVDLQQRPLGFAGAIKRCVAGIPTWLPVGIGFLWMLVDPQQLTWQDRLSGSRVIRLNAPATMPRR